MKLPSSYVCLFIYLFISNSIYTISSINPDHPEKDKLMTSNKYNINFNKNPNQITMNTDLKVNGALYLEDLTADKVKSKGTMRILSGLNSKTIETNQIFIRDELKVQKIISPNGVLSINGNVQIRNELDCDSIKVKGESFIQKSANQWKLISHDDFETPESFLGWSDTRKNSCKGKSNYHLGGHCNFADNEVKKVFKGLPKHKQLRISALYHMLDKWDGEEGYMKVNGEIKWSKKGMMDEKGINVCGGEYNDPGFNLKIDVILEHTDDNVEVTFGSTLKGDSCLHSYGVDDVMIYTK